MRVGSPLIVCLVGAMTIAIGWAQPSEIKIWGGLESKPKTAEGYTPEKAEIGIGPYLLFVLHGGAAGYTLAEREAAIYNRLTEALSRGPIHPSMIQVRFVRSAPTIYVGPVRLVSVYPSDAAAAGTTPTALAERWRARLAEVLPKITAPTGPKPTFSAAEVYEVAIGGRLLFRLRGRDNFPSLEERGRAVEARIVQWLSDGKAEIVWPQADCRNGRCVVRVGDLELVTATSEDAAANHTTPERLAEQWAAALRSHLPQLKGYTSAAAAQ